MIVSCGEALIDFLPRAESADAPATFAAFPGGSPFNVAIAIARLGQPAAFFGGLSSDLFGETLRKHLEQSGADFSLANFSDRPSTLAFVSVVNGNARYAFLDEGSAGRMLTENDLPALPKKVAALHCGSFSLAKEPCGSAFEALMRREKTDRVISFDINVRPTLIKNRDGYLARVDRLAAMADLIKLSEEDLEWLAPSSSFEALADRLQDLGARIVVLTRGAGGAVALSGMQRTEVPSIPVKVADTIGAGDTFTAAMLARLSERQLLTKHAVARLSPAETSDMLTFAARAAAITVSRPGANPPWLRELAELR
jgi:fructokinase